MNRICRAAGGGILVAAVALAVSGCGSHTVETVRHVAPLAASSTPISTPSPAAATPAPTPRAKQHRHRVTLTACDPNIRVKASTTTCAFAQNVFFAYWQATQRGDAASITAYSAATGRQYSLACTEGTFIACRADDGGYVRFPLSAVDAYDSDQAERYACTHDLGKSEADKCSDGGGDEKAAAGDECDPNYAGACLDPHAVDYDCEGGSGDGPNYTGEVEVVGDDPYGLDRDGDGIGCEDSGSSYSAPTTQDFGSGSGSVGTCADGTVSDSIGRPGACSHHGGVG